MTKKQVKRLNQLVDAIGFEAYGKLTSAILSQEERGEFLFKNFIDALGSNTFLLQNLIAAFFTWNETKDGIEYWSSVYVDALDYENSLYVA